MKTFRVVTRVVAEIVYEIDCEDEEEARDFYTEGTIIRDEFQYDDIEHVVEIDQAATVEPVLSETP